jgi:hypothetical protein
VTKWTDVVATKRDKKTKFFPLLFCCSCRIRDPRWIKIRVQDQGINIPDPQHWREIKDFSNIEKLSYFLLKRHELKRIIQNLLNYNPN